MSMTSVERIEFERGYAIGYERGVKEEAQRSQERMRSLILRQLNKKIGAIPNHVLTQIHSLSIEYLESLGEALVDFKSIQNLTTWLENHRKKRKTKRDLLK
ncbi:DUF4351 domain-containing protein [Pseudanabaenaceae cyanobacterium LEGE 13415]|nr:DUF4351 domain-containing protein [Pseudanabaenaceae cyanobacterium LEGE 13415]